MRREVLIDDVNLLARLHMRGAIPQSPRQREVTFSVEDVTRSLSRIAEAPLNGLVHGQSQEIRGLALTAEDLQHRGPRTPFISGDALTTWLWPLEQQMSNFSLGGLYLSRSTEEWNELYVRFEEAPSVPGLCVFATSKPDQWHLIDPTPPVLVASQELDAWPGIVLWSPTGHCALIPMSALLEVLNELREIGDAAPHQQPVEMLRRYDQALVARGTPQRSPKLLQLSDLHFGTREAAACHVLLSNHLDRVVKKVGRVVITGDLMETPKPDNLSEFDAFVSRIAIISRDNPIVIPGNHDERETYGSFGRSLEQVVRLDRQAVAVDHQLRCVFLGFDSTLDARLAEGFVSEEQTRRVAGQLELEISRSPEVEGYLCVALVHHHPLKLEAAKDEGFREYFEEYFKEKVLGMREGKRFLRWCAKRGAMLVLHGHKHRPRRRDAWVSIGSSELRKVMVVGCGTSLGVRERPLGYNLITWDVTGKAWSANFFESEPDGSGFFPLASGFSQEPWAMRPWEV